MIINFAISGDSGSQASRSDLVEMAKLAPVRHTGAGTSVMVSSHTFMGLRWN
jgi:hypothetical protein